MMKLIYFPIRARLEASNLILAYRQIPHEAVIIGFEEWGAGRKTDPSISFFQSLPSMELPNGKLISESGAITRYIARVANVYPTDIEAAAEADMLYELTMDMNLINPIVNWFPMDSEIWKKSHQSYFTSFPHWMQGAVLLLGDKSFFGGNEPHFADFAFFHICDQSLLVNTHALEAFPTVLSWYQRIKALPTIASYLHTRPNANTVGWGRSGSFILSTGSSSASASVSSSTESLDGPK